MAAVEQFALALHQILHNAHLPLAALAPLLTLGGLGPLRTAFLQRLEHLLKLSEFLLRILSAALPCRVLQALGAPRQLPLIEHSGLRVEGQGLGIFALQLFGQCLQMLANRLAQLLNAALQLGSLLLLR